MTTSILLSIPPLLTTPPLACFWRLSDTSMEPLTGLLIGEPERLDARARPWESALLRLLEEGRLADAKGFVVSARPYFVLDARLTLFRPDTRDGVSGVLASERER